MKLHCTRILFITKAERERKRERERKSVVIGNINSCYTRYILPRARHAFTVMEKPNVLN